MTTVVTDIPRVSVGKTVRELVFGGATKIVCEEQENKLWTIRAS